MSQQTITEKRTPNPEQKKAIEQLKNSVVAAGAGSGKTFVLAERFSYLVLQKGYKVDEILTLTFTKKATSEMYGRIYYTLRQYSTEASGIEQKRAKEALQNFHKAKIQTLDSYCNYVVRMASNLYGISPNFTLDDKKAKEQAYKMALPFLLAHKDNKAIQELVQTGKFDEIANSVFADTILYNTTVANPINFQETLEKQTERILSDWEKLINTINTTVHGIEKGIEELASEKSPSAIYTSAKKNFETYRFQLQDQVPFSISIKNLSEETQKEIEDYANALYHLANTSLSSKKCGLKDEINNLRQQYTTLTSLISYVLQYPTIQTVIPLLQEFQEEFNTFKRTSGILTFGDIAQLASLILKEQKEIRQLEKNNYKAIMIDEFQDDNEIQKQMLYYLAEKVDSFSENILTADMLESEKLFFVGDEKQSIYRFRGADVSVFRQLSKDLREGQLFLETNYRSHPALIAAFNAIFGGYDYPQDSNPSPSNPSIFLQGNDIPLYEAGYNKVSYNPQISEDFTFDPRFHITLINTNEDSSVNEDDDETLLNAETEAFYVAKKIRDLLDGNATVESKTLPTAKPEDIAILFRKYTKQYLYEKYLKLLGVPFSTDTMVGFFTEGPVNDIISFLRLCNLPYDTLSFANILKSPFGNISQSSVNLLLSQIDKGNINNFIPFTQYQKDLLPIDEQSLFSQLGNLYEEIKAQTKRDSIASTISTLWYEAGYRYETLWNPELSPYQELYDALFELGRIADIEGKSLTNFLDSLEELKEPSKKVENMDIPLERSGTVRLMSIHKSKGLEFPIVFICGGGEKTSAPRDSLTYFSPDWGITLNLPKLPLFKKQKEDYIKRNYFYELVKEEDDKKNLAEMRRIFYVAMTRAENRVFFTSTYKGKFEQTQGEAENPQTFIALLKPILSKYHDTSSDKISILPNSPFTFEEVVPLSLENVNKITASQKKTKNLYPLETKKEFIQKYEPLYNQILIEEPVIIESPYRTPSNFHPEELKTQKIAQNIGNLYSEIDTVISDTFTAAQFGTIAHAYLEAKITQSSPLLLQKDIMELSKNQLQIVNSVCTKMAEAFVTSDIGSKAMIASKIGWIEAEYEFKSRINNRTEPERFIILNGTMDLVFQMPEGQIYIVDYKTNTEIEPSIYYGQLAAYKQAIAAIRNTAEENVFCFLYYLRSNTSIDITEECKKVDISKLI
jgi:ATP-dependent helicase/nuclease subunit A